MQANKSSMFHEGEKRARYLIFFLSHLYLWICIPIVVQSPIKPYFVQFFILSIHSRTSAYRIPPKMLRILHFSNTNSKNKSRSLWIVRGITGVLILNSHDYLKRFIRIMRNVNRYRNKTTSAAFAFCHRFAQISCANAIT